MDELYSVTPDLLDSEAEEYEDSVADILNDGSDIDAIAGITDENEDEMLGDEEPEEEDPEVIDAAQQVQAMDVGEYADYDIHAVEDEDEECEECEEGDDGEIVPGIAPEEPAGCEDGECEEDDDDDDDEDALPIVVVDDEEEDD